MTADFFLLLLNLFLIFISAEIFTNGVESLGKSLSLSQAVVGSILAAVGTALPETILPLVAILLHKGDVGASVGIGAILGAPFMLTTLAFLMIGLTVFVSYLMRRRSLTLDVEIQNLKRDIVFFLVMYSIGIFVPMFLKAPLVVAIFLIGGYLFYLYSTFRGQSQEIFQIDRIYLERIFGGLLPISKFRGFFSFVQVLLALAIMIKGAHGFVDALRNIAFTYGFDPLLFSLLVAPVATELPEKFNSVTWTFKGRDTLALGNVTGAMVFQSTFPVSVGLIFTEWDIKGYALLSASLALLAALIVLGEIHFRRRLSPITLIFSGSFYLVYALLIVIPR